MAASWRAATPDGASCLDDLTQLLRVALINAVDRYDPTRQVSFAAFAVPGILGALEAAFPRHRLGHSGMVFG